MQIMPNNNSDSVFGLVSKTDFSSESSFMDAMQDAMASVDSGYDVSVSSAMAKESPTLVESPYSMQSTDGVTYTLEEVTFTKKELQELRQQLLKEGAPEETLKQFDILVDQPDGATLAQVIASLIGKKGGSFSAEDEQAITALLSQIDPSGDLAGDAIAFMRQGNPYQALNLVQEALDKMPADQRFEVDPDSMAALGRGLGLNAGTMQTIVGLMKGKTLNLNGSQFSSLMQPAKAQFEIDAANSQKLDAALEKTIKPIISKARNRMEKEKEAASRESRRVQQSRILIDRTVQQNSRNTMDETLAGATATEAGKAGGMIGKAGESRKEAAQLHKGQQAETVKTGEKFQTGKTAEADKIQTGQPENARFVANANSAKNQDLADNNPGQDKKGQQEGWEGLLNKVEVKPASASLNTNNNSFVYSMLNGNIAEQIQKMDAQLEAPQMPQLTQQVSQQVERGVLTAMRDGASRLDLQLHPAELGSLAITLIARNGELTAQIKSERTETAEMLQRQMETIRVNLEQQGLKVDKIEVQLENNQDNAQGSFDDLGQHNARQQEETRRQELTRLRNLAALRREDTNMAQGLHNVGQAANYAGNALHVVA